MTTPTSRRAEMNLKLERALAAEGLKSGIRDTLLYHAPTASHAMSLHINGVPDVDVSDVLAELHRSQIYKDLKGLLDERGAEAPEVKPQAKEPEDWSKLSPSERINRYRAKKDKD